MPADTRQQYTKRSSRVARDFLWRLTSHAPRLLREISNLREDGIGRFQQRYAPLFDRYNKPELVRLRDELRALWTNGKQMAMPISMAWNEFSRRLKEDREREPEKLGTVTLQEFICGRWLEQAHGGIIVFWEGRKREIGPDPYELPALLAYCSLLCSDKMRTCRNPDCPARYFVAGRRDQRYCSAECAAPAKREAKLRSWRKHRQKWPSQTKRAKSSRRIKR